MSNHIGSDRNCHTYCPYGKQCRYLKGENGIDVYECTMYYKLDDIHNDEMDMLEEIRRARGEEEDDW